MNIKISNKSYEIPRSWEQITIKQLCTLKEIEDPDTLTLFKILAGVPKKELSEVVWDENMDLATDQLKFLNNIPTFEVVTSFEFNGKYSINPDILSMTIGMYNDCMRIEKKYHDNELARITNLAATITLKGDQKEYSYKLTEDRAKEFENLPITAAYGVANFFLMGQKLYTANLKDYSTLNRKLKRHKLGLKAYQNFGKTISWFTTWRKKLIHLKQYTAKEST